MRDKHIEEMNQAVLTKYSNTLFLDVKDAYGALVDAGYRKSTDLAREIFEEIEASAKVKYWRGGGLVVFEIDGEDFVELKKKYIEETKNE